MNFSRRDLQPMKSSENGTEPHTGNILDCLPAEGGAEQFDTLVQLNDGKVERIVSFGQSSPEGFWYDQDHGEWVLVISGHARLEIANSPEPIELRPGDYINLAAHTRHRVAWTTPEKPTVWLAVHY